MAEVKTEARIADTESETQMNVAKTETRLNEAKTEAWMSVVRTKAQLNDTEDQAWIKMLWKWEWAETVACVLLNALRAWYAIVDRLWQ